MAVLILLIFALALFTLNIIFFIQLKRGRLTLLVAGIIMILIAPVFGFLSGYLFFYSHNGNGTGEGAGFAGALIGLLTLVNGGVFLVIELLRSLAKLIKERPDIKG
ncbi:inner-membrane translocator [Pseudalkalibacillus caeni]|uniref:Inner-membrane translocator n=2 Tax=Exobacillus caeni TaxID=2574798 RepID=A0A5R9F4G8_9BACL|nr:inner-membrane translocator [Pseudalkalibacillus caeni]